MGEVQKSSRVAMQQASSWISTLQLPFLGLSVKSRVARFAAQALVLAEWHIADYVAPLPDLSRILSDQESLFVIANVIFRRK